MSDNWKPKKPDKPDAPWFRARLKSIGISHKELAQHFGVPPNKIWMMLAGTRRIRPEEIAAWARVLEAPASAVAQRFGYDWPSGQSPVDGVASVAGVVSWYEPDDVKVTAPTPEAAGASVHALALESASGVFRRGTLFYFEPYDRVDRAAFGRLAVVICGAYPSGRGIVAGESWLRVPGEISEGRAKARGLDGAELTLARIVSATPIKWVRSS